MRTFRIRTIAPILAGLGLCAALAAPAHATENLGNCESGTTYHAANAPGTSGNGPMTQDTNGVWHLAQGFQGNTACS